jgi:membrane protein DedA with SNARE-associated domain
MDVASTGLLAIVALLLVKEAGVPIPVPGDLIVIGAGVAAGRGDLDPGVALVAIVVASIVGGVVQYGLLRSVARPLALRVLSRVASPERIDAQAERLRRGGARSVAIARSTPGVRIVAIAASALAGLPPIAFVTGLAIGNGLFIAAHFSLGYVLGEPVLAAVSRKYFLGAITGRPPDQRLGASVAAALWAADAGAAILRVHDVVEVADALAVRAVLRGDAEVPTVDPDDDGLKWIRGDG